uniref:Uncharacterized protein n=1 Tax=Hemiselmis tepida TaxID=464990 RepID=A0A7S0W3U2_9CRYP|eukprot:CAMPEP_0174927558 /NCGR_PEP_ID=MMETSP1355-20121228/18691_1 /TAXON_ID=464990 /ORGANISM="Hemiselmis tepida, Strain CCMP443" /LENGTH=694 /DNA_ID=CAMNT_0016173667 /DNA_START=29 /DNA_END=2113 /DNA_ORIENTATION=+
MSTAPSRDGTKSNPYRIDAALFAPVAPGPVTFGQIPSTTLPVSVMGGSPPAMYTVMPLAAASEFPVDHGTGTGKDYPAGYSATASLVAGKERAVFVEMPSGEQQQETTGMAMPVKLAHTVGLVVAVAIVVLVGAVLADGRSIAQLKHASELPRLTDYSLKESGLDYRADELLGTSYGVGLHHDSSGNRWNQVYAGATLQKYVQELGLHQVIAAVPSVIATDGLKHPAYFLSCTSLVNTGLTAVSFAIIAEFLAIFMMFFHLATLIDLNPLAKNGTYTTMGKAISVLVWLVLSVGFLVVCCLGIAAFYSTWYCDNPFVPSINISEHFDWTWGWPIANIGCFAAMAAFFAQFFVTSTNPSFAPAKRQIGSAVLALLVGVVVGMVACVSTAAGVGQFDEAPPVDPSVNPCKGQKPYHAGPGDKYFANVECMKDGVVAVLEQAGADVSPGYKGGMDAGEWRVPITERYNQTDLCAVNVHWHLGAEHRSSGQFDESGKGPSGDGYKERLGHRCHFYDEADPKFTTPYDWKHCKDMVVGETYEVHWPHSAAGACGTEWQFQTPFYDGVFCNDGVVNILTPLNTYKKIGVQSQTYTIVNDESYYHDNLMNGMIVDEKFGVDMTMYTGSTTGTSRDNDVCSRFAPITWQVDRRCHMISASSFDKMCEMMKMQKDDMSDDLHAHGSRETVADHLTANNQVGNP